MRTFTFITPKLFKTCQVTHFQVERTKEDTAQFLIVGAGGYQWFFDVLGPEEELDAFVHYIRVRYNTEGYESLVIHEDALWGVNVRSSEHSGIDFKKLKVGT